MIDPSAWGAPAAIHWVISVLALPMSICPQAMLYGRPSREIDLVRPVIACLVTVYPTVPGRGACAEIDPLLMIRPPCGSCAFIIRTAWCAHRYEPVRLVATIDCQPAGVSSSTAPGGAPVPALLTSRSTRPNRSRTAANSLSTDSASPTSAATGSTVSGGASFTVSSSGADRRPAATTCQPLSASVTVISRPSPEPAPVTTATR